MIVENNFISISSVVDKAMYTIHSNLVPFSQENFTLNFCWRSSQNVMYSLRTFLLFIPEPTTTETAFHSSLRVCLVTFLRHKNYCILLQTRDGTNLFGKISIRISQ